MWFKAAAFVSIMAAGAIEIILQVVLLLTFQVLEGFVYLQLALIIAFFMTGAGLGAGFISWWNRNHRIETNAIAYFIRIQTLLCILPLFIILLLTTLHGDFRHMVSSTAISWLFSVLALISGFIGGSHFSLAFLVLVSTGDLSKSKGSIVYALDLAGAAFGILIATVFILPVYGLIHSLLMLSTISAISLLLLLRHP
jgi:spermidine synthase